MSSDMARMQIGVDVNPADVNLAIQHHDKQIFIKYRPLLVKIYGASNDGTPAGEFSGFLYSQAAEIIVTAGHIVGFSGVGPQGRGPPAEKFRARYEDGFEEDVMLVNHVPNNVPDIAILRGSRRAPHSLLGDLCSTGDIVYAFGFSTFFPSPSFSKGMVSSTRVGQVAITAHADNGYSGGPVLDCRGQLVGLIKGSIGTTIIQVGITPAVDLHTVLLQWGQPGLANR
ncbi:hypothetical protein VOLCADRAFT_101114 [Volvox carteri f. nagariensis]|uniref:Serine protease n=1 Tax=Volvox carteri f. nagariensis TaxID=3068 RepID=D8ULS9_VOLCA|nr:uncharacterized protein VOLCADRAFT_101114 [Volvox carteri f. nagariensis]EFJ39319.1 hypothetical protein VOLCADRAFT_101114 [Volvox carteri f. nagariensis]|eukprot:XP_002959615.1 hypothetical protein VOLCADRAFT_101114 [Volvox carteri f. nagariensis]